MKLDLDLLAGYPHKPTRVPKNGQLVVPRPMLDALGLKEGDIVYFKLDANPPREILIIPASRVLIT